MKTLTRLAFAVTALLMEVYGALELIIIKMLRVFYRALPKFLQKICQRIGSNYRYLIREAEFGNSPVFNSSGKNSSEVNASSKKLSQVHTSSISTYQLRSPRVHSAMRADTGDVPGWVLVVLMTTGLVTAIWTIAAPRLSTILRNSLDAMNGIR
jgi:hypothetical protein